MKSSIVCKWSRKPKRCHLVFPTENQTTWSKFWRPFNLFTDNKNWFSLCGALLVTTTKFEVKRVISSSVLSCCGNFACCYYYCFACCYYKRESWCMDTDGDGKGTSQEIETRECGYGIAQRTPPGHPATTSGWLQHFFSSLRIFFLVKEHGSGRGKISGPLTRTLQEHTTFTD